MITSFVAGKELDTLIAGAVFGLTVAAREDWLRDVIWPMYCRRNAGKGMLGSEPYECFEQWRKDSFVYGGFDYQHPALIPRYSKDIDVAWRIVEHLTAGDEGWTFQLSSHVNGWRAVFGIANAAVEATAPLAICRAALGIVGYE